MQTRKNSVAKKIINSSNNSPQMKMNPSYINSYSDINELQKTSQDKTPQKNFLKNKRKTSDLKFEIESPSPKIKFSGKKNSPTAKDTLITSYFAQKKSSSCKKNLFNKSTAQSENLEDKKIFSSYLPKGENKLSFAKKLCFDNLPNSMFNNNYDLNNNSINLKFTDNSNETFEPFCEHHNYCSTSSFVHNKDPLHRQKGNLDKKDEKLSRPTISDKTLKIIKKLKNNKLKNRNFNLNNIHTTINIQKNNNLKNESIKNSEKVEDYDDLAINKILKDFSIKDKYEELLTRELALPCHYKNLFKKFMKLDETLNIFKSTHTQNTLFNFNEYYLKNFHMNFTQEEFQQILFITPHFYIYKWDTPAGTSDTNELYIEIPSNINQRLEEKYNENTNFVKLQTFPYLPLNVQMNNDLLTKRKILFKKILLHMTNEHHKVFLKNNGIITRLNPFKHKTWHSNFEIHKLPQLEKFKLIEKPKQKM